MTTLTPKQFIAEDKNQKRLQAAAKAFLSEDPTLGLEDYLSMNTGDVKHIKYDKTDGHFYYVKVDPLTGNETKEKIENLGDLESDALRANKFGTIVNADETVAAQWFDCIFTKKGQDMNCLGHANFNRHNFFLLAKKNLEGMHPLIALQTLRKFGFRKHLVADSTSGTQLWKVETVNHWQKHHLVKHHSAEAIQEMIDNPNSTHLLQYLGLIVQFVNASPAMLNKNYSGSSDEAMGKFLVPADAQKLKLDVPSPKPTAYYVDPSLANLVHMKYRTFANTAVGGPAVLFGGAQKDIYGGQLLQGILSPFGTSTFTPGVPMLKAATHKAQCEIVANIKNQGSNIMIDMFKGLVASLAAKGKPLSEDAKKAISQKLEQHKQVQEALLKTLCFLEEADSPDLMRKINDRYGKLAGKFQNLEEAILDALLKCNNGEYEAI
jgi:hypothetical protein